MALTLQRINKGMSREDTKCARRGETWPARLRSGNTRKAPGNDVKSEMRRYKKGAAKSGRGGKGGKVKSRKQAIAIGLSKARKKGKKVPKKKKGGRKKKKS